MAPRSAGLLLHPTSLPGPHGIGDVGPGAYEWVDFVAASGCSWWQVLPLGPTGYGDSPYQCFSAFAGNPYLVSPELLVDDGLLTHEDVLQRPAFEPRRVDYGAATAWKLGLLDRAFRRADLGTDQPSSDFSHFCAQQSGWLDDYALFMALKADQGGGSWLDWPRELVVRDSGALAAARDQLATEISRQQFFQFLFWRQWSSLRSFAGGKGVRIIGDAPIFVAPDSADVWAHPELFQLGSDRRPLAVAGVPPDYFSATGQLWGNPLYDWDVHAESGFTWWIQRIQSMLSLVDIIRIDHFRGFVDYWQIPAGAETAVNGQWLDGPGIGFFEAVGQALGSLPIIAEDLGELNPAVPALLNQLGLPGMKVVQFAFDGTPDNPFLPHTYPENCVAYSGTHDNNTTIGWFQAASAEERARAMAYLGSDGTDIAADVISAAWASAANLAVAPAQDFLRLDAEARMNTPGKPKGNWSWRMESLPGATLAEVIRDLNTRTERLNDGPEPAAG